MHRIILFLVLIALAAAGAAWIAEQTGDVALSWGGWKIHTSLPVFVLALGVVIVAAMLAWSILRGLWRTPGAGAPHAPRAASCARPPRHHPRTARGRPWRFQRRPRACRRGATPCRERSAGAAAARAIGATRRRPRGRAARLPRHGGAQGYAAARPARTVRRGAARRRSARRGGGRRRGAKTFAGIDLGVAGRAGIPLRPRRLERRAGDPRQQPRLGPGRQGDVPAAARRAADGARAGA